MTFVAALASGCTGQAASGDPTTTQVAAALTGTATISGTVSGPGGHLSGIKISLNGSVQSATFTDANGQYAFTGLVLGLSYSVSASGTGCNFSGAQNFNNLQANQTADFAGNGRQLRRTSRSLPGPQGPARTARSRRARPGRRAPHWTPPDRPEPAGPAGAQGAARPRRPDGPDGAAGRDRSCGTVWSRRCDGRRRDAAGPTGAAGATGLPARRVRRASRTAGPDGPQGPRGRRVLQALRQQHRQTPEPGTAPPARSARSC